MITIRLLGGAKKAIGRPTVDLDRSSVSVTEILQYLRSIAVDAHFLQPSNLIVAINGVDSSALQQSIAAEGDTVTVVTVVHGGSHLVNDNQVSIIGIRKITGNTGEVLDELRAEQTNLSIQAVNADAIYGIDHLLGILKITLEAEKRKIMIANRIETEFLLRLACTGQISEAIKRAGLKNSAGCFLAFSEKSEEHHRFYDKVHEFFEVDNSVLHATAEKKAVLGRDLGIPEKLDNLEFLNSLIERAAILVK